MKIRNQQDHETINVEGTIREFAKKESWEKISKRNRK